MTSSDERENEYVPPRSSWVVRILILVAVVGLCTVGTGFMQESVEAWTLSRDAGQFRSTKGEITRASVRSEGSDQVPEIKFIYTVDGKGYEGSNRYTANSYRDAKLASRESARHKVGSKAIIYYDPQDPERAVLQREVPMQRAYVRLVYALLFYGIAIFTIVTYIRSRKKMKVLAYAKHVEVERQRKLDAERAARRAREDEAAAEKEHDASA